MCHGRLVFNSLTWIQGLYALLVTAYKVLCATTKENAQNAQAHLRKGAAHPQSNVKGRGHYLEST